VPGELRKELLVIASVQESIGDTSDVVPERLPLVLLRPHVRTLEWWDLVADLAVEQISWRQGLRFHRLILSYV
jgi:hypothetical protein